MPQYTVFLSFQYSPSANLCLCISGIPSRWSAQVIFLQNLLQKSLIFQPEYSKILIVYRKYYLSGTTEKDEGSAVENYGISEFSSLLKV
jgi:hypothetical protein